MFSSLSINEKEFLEQAIKSKFRVDARGLYDYRHVDVRFGNENGQVLLKIGKTHILTQASLKLVSPQPGKPNEGFFRFNTEFSSLLHSAEYTSSINTLSEMRVDITRFIDKVLKSSRATDRESLCIVQGRLVWSLSVDLFLLNEDGNVMDACFIASVLCLMNTRLPEVTISKDQVKINYEKVKYLNVHHIPICTTFYFIEGIDQPILYANGKEEKLAKSRLSMCMNIFEDLCGMSTLGCLEIDPITIIQCSKIALQKTKELTRIIREAFANRHSQQLLDFISEKKRSQLQSLEFQNQKTAQQFLESMLIDEQSDDKKAQKHSQEKSNSKKGKQQQQVASSKQKSVQQMQQDISEEDEDIVEEQEVIKMLKSNQASKTLQNATLKQQQQSSSIASSKSKQVKVDTDEDEEDVNESRREDIKSKQNKRTDKLKEKQNKLNEIKNLDEDNLSLSSALKKKSKNKHQQ